MEKGKRTMNLMAADICLPIEIITNILLLLPPKVLVQLTCVCKEWKNLILDPEFAKEYRQNEAANGGRNFILYMSAMDGGSLSFNLLNDKTWEEDSRLRIPPLPYWTMNVRIIGCFAGVLCLTDLDFFGRNIYLCNPSIWKYRIVRSSTMNLCLVRKVILGFGHQFREDGVVHDFKVVRIAHGVFRNLGGTRAEGYDVRAEVYSMITDSWKAVEVDYFPWYIFQQTSEIFVHESLHWLAMDGSTLGGRMIILAFDLREEEFKFKEIDLPRDPKLEGEGGYLEFVGVFRDELLSLLVFCPADFGGAGQVADLWVMNDYGKEESWTKLYSVTWEVGIKRPLKFTKHEEIILMDDEEHVFVYSFVTHHITYLGIEGTKSKFVTYTKSLALINQRNRPITEV